MTDNPVHGNDFVSIKYENGIIFFQVNKSNPTDEEWTETKDIMRGYYKILDENDAMFGMLFNIVNLGILSMTRCVDWADFLESVQDVTSKRVVSSSVITNSFIVNELLNTFLTKLYTSRQPVKMTDSIDEGVDFIRYHYKKRTDSADVLSTVH